MKQYSQLIFSSSCTSEQIYTAIQEQGCKQRTSESYAEYIAAEDDVKDK
jgi:hypothetical protein